MKKFIISLCVVSMFLLGCATETSRSSPLAPGMAKKSIEKGRTTQHEILTMFGGPNIVTKNKSGNEVWTYERMSAESSHSEGLFDILILRGQDQKNVTSTRSFTLMIEFDEHDVVTDYSYRSSEF